MEPELEGYRIGLHGALAEPILLAGIPRTAAIVIGTVSAALTLGLQTPWIGLPLGAVLYGVSAWLTRRDGRAFDVLARHLRHRAYLDG